MIYLTAKWCSPCKTLMPKIEKVCNDFGEPFQAVDIEEYPHVVPEGVTSVPTLLFRDGTILTGPQVTPLAVRKTLG